jgi:DNA-binding CsgD family transcriptional regulator
MARGEAASRGLLERGPDVARLDAGVAAAGRGDGSVILVEGEPGIGKTRLLSYAADAAELGGLRVLRARGIEVEREVAFGVVRQLLEAVLSSAGARERASLLEGPARLSRAVFDVADGQLGPPGSVESAGGVMHGVYWLIANIAGRGPLALIVDDAHWSDVHSLRALGYVGRRIEGLPGVLVLAARSPVDDRPELAEFVADRALTRVRPRPLSRAATASLFAALDPGGRDVAADAVERAHTLTGGNPFLLVELVQTVAQAGGSLTLAAVDALGASASESLARAVMLRVGELGAGASAFARAVAVLGDDAEFAHVCALAELARPLAVAAAARLVASQILADEPRPRFVHPLVRAAVYRDQTVLERAFLHERAAAVLGRVEAAPARIAAHLLLSQPSASAAVTACLRAAAADAMSKGDPLSASHYLARALAEPPADGVRADVLLELGLAELLADAPAAAAVHLRGALERLEDPQRRVDAGLALARALGQTAGSTSAIVALEEVGARLRGDAALRLEIERTSLALYVTDLAAGAAERMKAWSTLAGETPTERLGLAIAALAHGFDPRATLGDALPLARRALADGRLIAEQTASAPPFGNACYVLTFAEDLDTLERETALAFADARARGSTFAFMTASIGACMSHIHRGDLASAIAHADAAVSTWPELRRTLVAERWASASVFLLIQGLLDWGDVERARELAVEWSRIGDLDSAELGMIRLGRGLVAAADDDNEPALADLLAYGEISRRAGYEDRAMPWRLFAAEVAVAMGREAQAVALADEAVTIARTWGAPGGLGRALRVRALAAGPAEASERLAEAVELLRGSVCRLELAKAQYALGVALLRCGRRMDGRRALERALDGATRCGAGPLAGRAHAELKVAGARPRRLQFSGVASLTASELRIARMAAAEMTNRTIAQDLFVTPKTVESHLSNVYRKLGISSRGQLATLLDEDRAEPREPGPGRGA